MKYWGGFGLTYPTGLIVLYQPLPKKVNPGTKFDREVVKVKIY